MKHNTVVFTLLIGVSVGLITFSCAGCNAGKPRNKVNGTARNCLYSIGGGVVQAEGQGFNIFFLIEGVTPMEYKSAKEESPKTSAVPKSFFDKPQVIYEFDPEEITELKRQYNALLPEPNDNDSRTENQTKRMKLKNEIFMAVAKEGHDYKEMVRERESEERKEEYRESRQAIATNLNAHMKIAEDFVRSGKKCTVLIVSWKLMEGNHPTQDLGPEHGIIDQRDGPNFDFPMKDGIIFDKSAGKLRFGTQMVAGLPPADGKCYVLNPEMKFVPIDVQTTDLLSKFVASINQIVDSQKNLSTRTGQSSGSHGNFADSLFITLPVPVDKIPWSHLVLPSVDTNRIELYQPKYSWKVL